MFGSIQSKTIGLCAGCAAIVIAGLLAALTPPTVSTGSSLRVNARGPFVVDATAGSQRPQRPVERGQYGGDLNSLRSFYTAPAEGESNHYFDLWESGSLVAFARVQGLTNNRALFIDSHGVSKPGWKSSHYVFRPNATVLIPGREQSDVPGYSMADIAKVMGPAAAAEIHNIIIAGCNEAGALRPSAFRHFFLNATNITFMTPGQRAYKPMFFETLSQHSHDVGTLYGRPVDDDRTSGRMEIFRSRVEGAVPLGIYVAELYHPGDNKPYRRQRAGRELLDPDCRPAPN